MQVATTLVRDRDGVPITRVGADVCARLIAAGAQYAGAKHRFVRVPIVWADPQQHMNKRYAAIAAILECYGMAGLHAREHRAVRQGIQTPQHELLHSITDADRISMSEDYRQWAVRTYHPKEIREVNHV
jgi:hypothetical protein